MSFHSGHNWDTSIQAEREALRAALASTQMSLDLAGAAQARTDAELTRTRWEGDAAAPYDRALAAREKLRATQRRRAEIYADLAECDDDVLEDYDDAEV